MAFGVTTPSHPTYKTDRCVYQDSRRYECIQNVRAGGGERNFNDLCEAYFMSGKCKRSWYRYAFGTHIKCDDENWQTHTHLLQCVESKLKLLWGKKIVCTLNTLSSNKLLEKTYHQLFKYKNKTKKQKRHFQRSSEEREKEVQATKKKMKWKCKKTLWHSSVNCNPNTWNRILNANFVNYLILKYSKQFHIVLALSLA